MNSFLIGDRRGSLEMPAIDALLRLRMNGAPPGKFDSESYALDWVKNGHYKSDALMAQKPSDEKSASAQEQALQKGFELLEDGDANSDNEDEDEENDTETDPQTTVSIHHPRADF
jgi:hypothetical protein